MQTLSTGFANQQAVNRPELVDVQTEAEGHGLRRRQSFNYKDNVL